MMDEKNTMLPSTHATAEYNAINEEDERKNHLFCVAINDILHQACQAIYTFEIHPDRQIRRVSEAFVIVCWAVTLLVRFFDLINSGFQCTHPRSLGTLDSTTLVILLVLESCGSLVFIGLCWNHLCLKTIKLMLKQVQLYVIVLMLMRAVINYVFWQLRLDMKSSNFDISLQTLTTFFPLGAFLFLDALDCQSKFFRIAMPVVYSLTLLLYFYIYSYLCAGSVLIVNNEHGQGYDGYDPAKEVGSSLGTVLGVSASYIVTILQDPNGLRLCFPISRVTLKSEVDELLAQKRAT